MAKKNKTESWPSRFGTLGDKYGLNEVFGEGEGLLAKYATWSDETEPFQSMVNGQVFTSKSKYRQHLKDHGYLELGNESTAQKPSVYAQQQKEKANSERRQEQIHRAIELVKHKMAPLSEFTRERCKLINKNMRDYNYDRRSRNSDE